MAIFVDPKTGKASSTQQPGYVPGEQYAQYNAVGKGTQAGGMTANELANQAAADAAAALRISNPAMAADNEARMRAAGLNLPSIVGSNASPSQGTAETIGANNAALANTDSSIGLVDPMKDTNLAAEATRLQQARDAINTQTQADIAAIDAAGAAAGEEYNPLIIAAQEEQRQGMGKAVVTAGQRGGLMNTQFAGSAAAVLTPEARQALETLKAQGFDVQLPGNESWVGKGGELENIRNVYSANISKIQALQKQAIAAARSAAMKYQRDGKIENYNIAKDLYDQAKGLIKDSNDLKIQQAEAERNARNDARAKTTSDYNIMKDVPLGQSVTVNGETFTGIAVPDATKSFFSGSDIVALMKALPEGTSQVMTDPNTGTEYTITGLSKEQPDYLTATDDKGNMTFIDKNNLQAVKTIKGIGKTKTQAANVTLNLTQGQSDALTSASKNLNASKGIKKPDGSGDTYYNTDTYIKERDVYGATPGADTKDFDLQYSWNLNPDPKADPKAAQILNSIGQAPKKKSASEVIGEALGSVNFDDNQ